MILFWNAGIEEVTIMSHFISSFSYLRNVIFPNDQNIEYRLGWNYRDF